MKITINIECESIQDFHSHLLKIFEDSIILSHQKGTAIEQSEGCFDPATDEYTSQDINTGHLDDDNCYGSHEVKIFDDEEIK